MHWFCKRKEQLRILLQILNFIVCGDLLNQEMPLPVLKNITLAIPSTSSVYAHLKCNGRFVGNANQSEISWCIH
jgi:hypothetical protein